MRKHLQGCVDHRIAHGSDCFGWEHIECGDSWECARFDGRVGQRCFDDHLGEVDERDISVIDGGREWLGVHCRGSTSCVDPHRQEPAGSHHRRPQRGRCGRRDRREHR